MAERMRPLHSISTPTEVPMYIRYLVVLVVSAAVALMGAIPFAVAGEEQEMLGSTPAKKVDKADKKKGWVIALEPYASFVGMNGTVGVGGRRVKMDLSYGDLSKDVRTSASVALEARKGKHGILFDVSYVRLTDDAILRDEVIVVPVDATIEMTTIQALYSYRFFDTPQLTLEGFGGLRYWNLNNKIELDIPMKNYLQRYADVETWIDPIIGIKAVPHLGESLSFPIKVDIGGFDVGSRLTSKGSIGVNYMLFRNFSIQGGYGYTHVNYRNRGTIFDVTFKGPYVSAGFIF